MKNNKNFGFFFFTVLILSLIYSSMFASSHLIFTSNQWTMFLFLFASFILFLTLLAPNLLEPINKGWMALGYLLGRIVNPVVLGVIFFLLITPVATIGRLTRRDILRLKIRETSSYWVNRDQTNLDSNSFKRQF
jgi:hypothetical protein